MIEESQEPPEAIPMFTIDFGHSDFIKCHYKRIAILIISILKEILENLFQFYFSNF